MLRLLKFLTLFCLGFFILSVGSILAYVALSPEIDAPTLSSTAIVNDVTGMNPIVVEKEVAPKTIEEVQTLIREHAGSVSVGGGRYSMGGQIGAENSLHLDMRQLNEILELDKENKRVRVQAGVTWRKLQEAIDPENLSVQIMQSYANFTVGGSLSVNVHGRYIGGGPIISSVESIKLVFANGELLEASRVTNPKLFYAAIGGYGGIGVIVEATLRLAENTKVKREYKVVTPDAYPAHFESEIKGNTEIIFQNGDLLPPHYNEIYSVAWKNTGEAPTVPSRLANPQAKPPFLDRFISWLVFDVPYGVYLRPHLESKRYKEKTIEWRNFEASYDVSDLAPISTDKWSYALQEYFVPVSRFTEFVPEFSAILKNEHVHVANVSIRHATADTDSLLSWAREDVFAFVLYYWQYSDPYSRRAVGEWTRKLVEASLRVGGAYYLPYQIHASLGQFSRAYPRSSEFFALKREYDPSYKFRNKLFDAYFEPTEERRIQEASFGRENYARPEEQTYLTLPEWYLVFASEDLAQISSRAPTYNFPYFHSIGQFWKLYSRVWKATKKYPTNYGYHFMNLVIGYYTSLEYLAKGLYENTVGRISHAVAKTVGAPKDFTVDALIRDENLKYAAFIHTTPWYAYPFYKALGPLWKISAAPEQSKFHHYERKLSYTAELLIKGTIGKIFAAATGSIYGAEAERLQAIVKSDSIASAIPEAVILSDFGSGTYLVSLPRYEAFTKLIQRLVSVNTESLSFLELAGNRNIAVTLIAPIEWKASEQGLRVIDEIRLLSDPSKKRVAVSLDVRVLLTRLREFNNLGVRLDHVYDY